MRQRRIAAVMVLAASVTITCAHETVIVPPKEHPRGPIPICAGEDDNNLTVLTANAGLARGVISYATPRGPAFAGEVAKAAAGTGIVCLQEVWQEEDAASTLAALGLPDANAYRVDTRGRNEDLGRFVCTQDQIAGTKACAIEKCSGLHPDQTTVCVHQKCKWPHLAKLRYLGGLECLNCLAASVGKPIDAIVEGCTDGRGVSRVYGGANGVILASKWPLRNREHLDLPASAVNRSALFATVDVPGAGPIEIACAHLTSPEDGVPPTNPRFASWYDEQAEQFRLVSEKLLARAGTRPSLLIGDLNTGVKIDKGQSVRKGERNWDKVQRAGWDCSGERAEPFTCSMCADNALRGFAGNDRLIDHVLVRDPVGSPSLIPVCIGKTLTEPVTIMDYQDRPVSTPVSDHYGIIVKFRIR